jgi:hypothetical protein
VYRHVIAPAIRGGASVMDNVFGDDDPEDNVEQAKSGQVLGLVLNIRT